MDRTKYGTGAPWEKTVGYSRAVRTGNVIEVAGTVSVKDGKVYAQDDPYLQAKRCLEIIGDALSQLGATYHDVVRTRMFVTNIQAHWQEVGRAHGEVFGDIQPATTMVEVSRLIDPAYLVEIEATAIVTS
jgi:enamine deaminase RidA (YjgF/YER057c/UK114 family)